jgi:hypothetical protein
MERVENERQSRLDASQLHARRPPERFGILRRLGTIEA